MQEDELLLAAPPEQKTLAGHELLVPTLVPARQKKPYGHGAIVPSPTHTNPAVHGPQSGSPGPLNWPAGHTAAAGVADVEPAGHA